MKEWEQRGGGGEIGLRGRKLSREQEEEEEDGMGVKEEIGGEVDRVEVGGVEEGGGGRGAMPPKQREWRLAVRPGHTSRTRPRGNVSD